mgnify:CR=1 FL=1
MFVDTIKTYYYVCTPHVSMGMKAVIISNYTDCNGNWSFGVGVDNFAIHSADQNELIAIDPYAGWAEAGSTIDVLLSIPNHHTSYTNTSIEITAASWLLLQTAMYMYICICIFVYV